MARFQTVIRSLRKRSASRPYNLIDDLNIQTLMMIDLSERARREGNEDLAIVADDHAESCIVLIDVLERSEGNRSLQRA